MSKKPPANPTKSQVAQLSESEIKQLGESATKLYELSQQQLVEYQLWLKTQIQKITDVTGKTLDPVFVLQLLQAVDQIKCAFTRVEPKMKAMKRDKSGIAREVATVTAMYIFPDILMDTMRTPP